MNPEEASQIKSSVATPPTPTLAQLTTGQIATVLSLTGSDGISMRLLEMGVIPGTTVTLVGKAPLGDPLEFELRGYRLSLRKTEAERVAIKL
jgi:ferrous iron transport protein A